MYKKIKISIVPKVLFSFLLVGMIQYLPTVLNNLLIGNVILWNFSSEVLIDAGLLKYVKDIYLILFGVYWVYWCSSKSLGKIPVLIIEYYFIWVTSVVIIGCLGYLFDLSPFMFFKAGIRWVVLFHAAVGFFVILATNQARENDNITVYYLVLTLAILDAFVVLLQLNVIGLSNFSSFRLSGFFSNAAVGGFFAVSLSLISVVYLKVELHKKLWLLSLCLFIAVASGTRVVMICVFIFFLSVLYDFLRRHFKGNVLAAILSLLIPIFITLSILLYSVMLDAVGRGGILEAQLNEGGRIYHFFYYVGILLESDLLEFLVGRGLGLGTNTAFTLVENMGYISNSFRYNWLVDNAFLTTFFQVGLLGSIIFWSGIFMFLFVIRCNCNQALVKYFNLVTFVFFLTILAGNPFEQPYLIITFMLTYGVIFKSKTSEVI